VPSTFWDQNMAKRPQKLNRAEKPASELFLKPVDLAKVRDEIECLVGNHARSMVQRTIEEAKKGRYLALRFLFELARIPPAAKTEVEAPEGESLAQTLLERLGLLSPQEMLDNLNSHPLGVPASSEHDAVE